MKRPVQITIIIVLVLSVLGNAVLGSFLFITMQRANALVTKINKTNLDLSDTKTILAKTQKDLQTASENIKHNADRLAEMNLLLAGENAKLIAINCSVTIPTDSVKGVSTNQALIDPITKAAESYYSINSVSTTFELLWNNTKTATFTLRFPDKSTSKILVSWGFNTNRVKSIFNMGDGCLYYIN
jgi:hypothetical protein